MKIIPYGNYVLLKFHKIDRIGKILLPHISWEYTMTATVLEVGEKVKNIKKGDNVVYSFWGVKTLPFNNEEIGLVKEDDILLVLLNEK